MSENFHMKSVAGICLVISALMADPAFAQQPANSKKIILEVAWLPASNAEVFVVEGQNFKTVASLKKFLATQPKGTLISWDPGCVRIGDSPLLSSPKEMKEFRLFLEKHKLKFVTLS